MNSNINIYFNKIPYGKYIKYIDNIIENFTTNNKILFKDLKNKDIDTYCNNIMLLKLFNLNYCYKCNNFSDYVGFCIKHINKNSLQCYYDDFKNIFECNNELNIKYINNYIYNLLNYYRIHIYKLSNIMKYYESFILSLYDFSNQNTNNKKYINNIYNINYYKLNTHFDKNISINIIDDFYSNTTKIINIICIIVFLYKKYKYQKYLINYILTYKCITQTFISNSDILYNHIINSNIINNIEFIETEKVVSIENHPLRFDIFIIIKHQLKLLKLVIETDEKHHKYQKYIPYDIIKDKYCIKNGISLLRLKINNKINENNINFALFFIKYLIEYGKPIYYFDDEYIDSHIKTINNDIYNLTFGKIKNINNIKNTINNTNSIYNIENIDFIIKNDCITDLLNKFSNKDEYFKKTKYLLDDECVINMCRKN